ncbi:MAG: ABC transporter permease [Flexistipes sinusarabici]|uniref:ABC transporter permease n=1 Tax=Flexistipes sinusarabici TaxID=2352 RepID=A0A5D0MJ58_FLESI|nr:ABC transporter permease [Flexistipes sinusarabici]TYB33006.1 MAG: ABC transporter permease [Flexistipes sinusarabici]
MFFRLIKRTFTKGFKSKVLAVAAIMLGTSMATAMLSISMDIGDKMNRELKSYGSNIVVKPESAYIPAEINGVEIGGKKGNRKFLTGEDALKIKMIFWRHNIVDLAPYLSMQTKVKGRKVTVKGTWFDDEVRISSGEKYRLGIKDLKSWWEIKGEWIQNGKSKNLAMVGKKIASENNISKGDLIQLKFNKDGESIEKEVKVTGIISSGDEAENQIFVPLKFLQSALHMGNKIEKIEVSALTSPVNDLARKAGNDPESLTAEEFETWYCTAYANSIAYQIEEVIPGAVAEQVRQISESESKILSKINLLMILVTIAALISSSLGISSIMTTKVLERRQEIGLMKAIGAEDINIVMFFLAEIVIFAFAGGVLGFFLGSAFANIIGIKVFSIPVAMKLLLAPFVVILAVIIAVVGSISPLKIVLKLDPAEVLHG